MKNIKVFLFFILLTGLTLSCDQKEKIAEAGENNAIETEETLSSEEGEDHPNQVAFRQYPNAKKIIEIDERVDPSRVVKSLRWEKQTKDHGSEFIQVTAFLNEDGFPMKITEQFIDGNFRPQGERNYYLEDQKLIAFIELADVWIDSNITNYIEKRTLYNDDMPVITQTRKAQDYTQIEFENWKNIATEHHSLEKVNKILNGSGEFQTYFISVIKADKDRKSTRLNSSHVRISYIYTLSLHDALPIFYIEKRTLYNDDMPVITQTRKAQDYTQIEFENWKNIATEHHSLEKVNKILNGSGEFQTYFISVIKADNLFILLGENKPQNQERYTTALRIDEMTPFIEDLLNNLDKYKFRPVDIEFTVVGGSNEAEYRVLTDIAWKNK